MLPKNDNPPLVFPEGSQLDEMSGTWWVAHTKARQEKAFAHDLRRRGTSYFLPLVERLRIVRGRKSRSLLPLFPSYVFVCGDEEKRLDMFRTRRLAGTIRVTDQRQLARELAQIQRALDGDALLMTCPGIKKGQRCRIVAGPFEGFEGVVSERRGSTRLVLAVRSVAQAVELEVDASFLERIE